MTTVNKMNMLIVADQQEFFDSFKELLSDKGWTPFFCKKKEDPVSLVKEKEIKIVLLDFMRKEFQDTELIKEIKSFDPLVEIIIIGESVSSDKIGELINLGICEYITRPLRINELKSTLERIENKKALRKDTFLLEQKLNRKYFFHGMVGKNPFMLETFALIEKIARYPVNVFISGSTGTGKEMAARAIHELSLRSNRKFVVCDCTTIPENLFESELFGYVKGAFTGANKIKRGLFEEAERGTIFLDEIGDLPLSVQSKLLRVLEEKHFRRLGSNELISVDIRILSASSRNLREGVKNKTFREDLFHRLHVVEVKLRDLKDRKEDIPLLSRHFLDKCNNKYNKGIRGMSQRFQKILLSHDWPGNVRELENVIEHSVALSQKTFIDIEDFPEHLQNLLDVEGCFTSEVGDMLTLEEMEKKYIIKILKAMDGNINQTAQKLGVSRYTLYRKLKKFELS
jgi:DNA-binding NtrC family response regulator